MIQILPSVFFTVLMRDCTARLFLGLLNLKNMLRKDQLQQMLNGQLFPPLKMILMTSGYLNSRLLHQVNLAPFTTQSITQLSSKLILELPLYKWIQKVLMLYSDQLPQTVTNVIMIINLKNYFAIAQRKTAPISQPSILKWNLE